MFAAVGANIGAHSYPIRNLIAYFCSLDTLVRCAMSHGVAGVVGVEAMNPTRSYRVGRPAGDERHVPSETPLALKNFQRNPTPCPYNFLDHQSIEIPYRKGMNLSST